MTISGGLSSGLQLSREDELLVSFLEDDLRTRARGLRLLGGLGLMASRAWAEEERSLADTLSRGERTLVAGEFGGFGLGELLLKGLALSSLDRLIEGALGGGVLDLGSNGT